MLEEELWLSKIAEKGNIDIDTSNRIFRIVVSYFERILAGGKTVVISDIACIKTIVTTEFIAIVSDNKHYLCPPYIALCIEKYDSKNIGQDNVFLFDEKIISELSGINITTVKPWISAFLKNLCDDLKEGKEVKIKDVMTIYSIVEDDKLKEFKICLSENIYLRLNKAFSAFNKIEIFGYDYKAFMLEEKSVESLSDLDITTRTYIFKFSEEKCEEENEQIIEPEKTQIVTPEPQKEIIAQKKEEKTHSPIERKRKKNENKIWYFIFVLILVFLCGFLWFVFFYQKSNVSQIYKPTTQKNKKEVKTTQQAIIDTTKKETQTDSLSASTPIPEQEKTDTIYIKEGDRLNLYALKKYGNKVFWVYIYQENKNVISNPNAVEIGTRIILPPASKYKIDSKDNNSVNRALILQENFNKTRK